MSGPLPKPTALKILAGNPGKRPLNTREPVFPLPTDPPPVCLNTIGRREWKRLYPHLYQQGLFTVADVAEFTGYCQAWSEIPELLRDIRKNGRTYEKHFNGELDQIKARPQVAMLDRAWHRVHTFATSFGLSPAARTRIKANPQKEIDPFEQLLTGAQ